MFVYNWNTDVNDSTCARCYVLYAYFMFPPYLSLINIEKVRVSLSRVRVSAHRLEIETGRWNKPANVPLNERKCRTCITYLEKNAYIEPFYWKISNMPKLIELKTTENVTAIRTVSMYIMKAFEIRTTLYFD